MPRYRVDLSYTSYHTTSVEVEADDEEEAESLAIDQADDWDSEDNEINVDEVEEIDESRDEDTHEPHTTGIRERGD